MSGRGYQELQWRWGWGCLFEWTGTARETDAVAPEGDANWKRTVSGPLNQLLATMAEVNANGSASVRRMNLIANVNGSVHHASDRCGLPSEHGPASVSDYELLVSDHENDRGAPRGRYRDCESDRACANHHHCIWNALEVKVWEENANVNAHDRVRAPSHDYHRGDRQRESANDHENASVHPTMVNCKLYRRIGST